MPKLIGSIFSHRRLEASQKATVDASPFPFLFCLKPAAHTWSKSSDARLLAPQPGDTTNLLWFAQVKPALGLGPEDS